MEDIVQLNDENEDRIGLIKLINKMFPLRNCVPSKIVHCYREYHNYSPNGKLVYNGEYDQRGLRVFVNDKTLEKWHEMPWYLNLFHKPWKNTKMINYDCDYFNGAPGSSEIIIPKKEMTTILKQIGGKHVVFESLSACPGSYNYRDFRSTNHWKHFWGDLFPVLIYFKCIGE